MDFFIFFEVFLQFLHGKGLQPTSKSLTTLGVGGMWFINTLTFIQLSAPMYIVIMHMFLRLKNN